MKRILVVDDDKEFLSVFIKRLEYNKFEVIAAQDSCQALEQIQHNKPDLVILDLLIPAGGGELVLDNMKKSKEMKDIPVIVLTGTRDDVRKTRILVKGVSGYFEKPYDNEVLINKINQVFGDK